MIKERTPSNECREAVRRLVDALQRRDDFEGAIEGELADLSDEAKGWAAATYLNQAARESLRVVVRAAEIAAQKRLDTIRRLDIDPVTRTVSVAIERQDGDGENLNLSPLEVRAWLRQIGLNAEEMTFELELHLTDALLESRFTLRDGTFVSWGDATVAQHKERIAIFAELARTNIEGMVRHAKAIELIRSHGVATLRDVAS